MRNQLDRGAGSATFALSVSRTVNPEIADSSPVEPAKHGSKARRRIAMAEYRMAR
jgi:hypothetical protein